MAIKQNTRMNQVLRAFVEDLMTRQSEFHEALEAEIAELGELSVKLQPAPEDEANAPTKH